MIDLAKQAARRMGAYAKEPLDKRSLSATNIVAYVNRHILPPLSNDNAQHNHQLALRIPVMDGNTVVGVNSITWLQLGQRIASCQRGLNAAGLNTDDQVVVILQPSIDMYCLTLALLGSGMVPVFIDVSMGLHKIRQALSSVTPKLVLTHQRLFRIARWLP